MARTTPSVLNRYTRTLIRVKARQLVRKYGFRRGDEEDLRQELTVRLLKRARRYNPARASLHTFADRVAASLAATLMRERRRQKSAAHRAAASLELRRDGGHEGRTTLREALAPEDLGRRTGAAPVDRLATVDRDDALQIAVATLPPHLQAVCAGLTRASKVDVAQELGLSRHQIYKAVTAIRAHFRAAGLE